MKKIKIKFFKGVNLSSLSTSSNVGDIREHFKALVIEARRHKCLAAYDIKDRTVLASEDSNPDLLFRDFMRSQYGLIPQIIIGPYPEKKLTDEEEQKFRRYPIEHR